MPILIWEENYLTEKKMIEQAVGIQYVARINHYGSTSVLNLIAKATVDILLEIKEDADIKKL